ncbi:MULTISPECIES: MlaE family ABC transporter permease [Pseudomonas]|uniref:Phospholipid/cholesterol/gamma-HCH transport system permease protein n=1 Tax=Pseudomonas segetis TaxID=298908 RepID=A0A239GAF0_9PSED|nr:MULTISPECIES: ABC transporter permease [Pseudomonas]SNS65423.1 phospholipid/cholesterol/gamma-HCH transport system permease protein [Pseudomonas segetis]
MTTAPFINALPLDRKDAGSGLRIGGDWTLAHFATLEPQVMQARQDVAADATIILNDINQLDTAGAALLVDLLGEARLETLETCSPQLSAERRQLLQSVGHAITESRKTPPAPRPSSISEFFGHIGIAVDDFLCKARELVGFFGLTVCTMLSVMLKPSRWRITSLTSHLQQTGLNAVPIVALLTFLVGAVVAFLGATILADFGASIYTINLVAFSFLREFGVLLTAILMAGRTASAFTAQIGSMKANEEIDAIRTLGLSPIELLVVPRVCAMLIALPVLTFIAMICGIVGGAMVCALTLDISVTSFISIFHESIELKHFLVGMVKAPIFAFLIAIIGCLEGFKVTGSAQSVGERTTSSVVQSIFVVILLDAIFALFMVEMGW